VEVTDLCGDSLMHTYNIGWHPLPTPMMTASPAGCGPLSVLFTNTTPLSMVGGNCSWVISNGATSSACDTMSTVLYTPGLYDATLTITSPDGCVNDSTFVGIAEVYPDPVAFFSWTPVNPTILDGDVTFNDLSTGAVTWDWDIAGLMTSNAQNPSFDFTQQDSGDYQVCLGVSSQYGCLDTICQMITIYDVNLVYVPNTFTPDGDGVNDIFLPVVRGVDPKDYELMIFNRWGELIFQSQLVGGGWDGTHKSKQAKQDVYVWKLKTRDKYNEEKKEYIGHVNLLR
jgi:gliding motility-associated-like protein